MSQIISFCPITDNDHHKIKISLCSEQTYFRGGGRYVPSQVLGSLSHDIVFKLVCNFSQLFCNPLESCCIYIVSYRETRLPKHKYTLVTDECRNKNILLQNVFVSAFISKDGGIKMSLNKSTYSDEPLLKPLINLL